MENATHAGPLSGVRVVEFSIAMTGPFAAAVLADQGADVVKVERPGMGDISRWVGAGVNGMTAVFLLCNRGKRSIAVDLATPEGLDVARRLCAEADVIIQNFRTGVMDRLGLGYQDIAALNPEVIYTSLSGYGSTGPYAERSAYDTSIQAYAGIATSQADPEDGVPVFVRQTIADKVTALFAAQAVSAALYARDHGAGGQHLELSMMDAVVSFLWMDCAGNEVLMDSDRSSPSSIVGGFSPFRFLDGWGVVAPTSDSDFAGMCRAFEVEGYEDPAVATMTARRTNRGATEAMMDLCRAHAANLTQVEATERLDDQRVPFSMVLSPEELIGDPHAVAVGLFEERDHPVAGRVRIPRHPTRFSATPAHPGGPTPSLGEQTNELLEEIGLGEAAAGLRERGIVA